MEGIYRYVACSKIKTKKANIGIIGLANKANMHGNSWLTYRV
jgi:hypothetical protein